MKPDAISSYMTGALTGSLSHVVSESWPGASSVWVNIRPRFYSLSLCLISLLDAVAYPSAMFLSARTTHQTRHNVDRLCRNCAQSACRDRRAVDRPFGNMAHSENLFFRSLQLYENTTIITVTAAVVAGLAICGICVILLWYRRRKSRFLPTDDEGCSDWIDKSPPSARYIAPLPHIYAERLASVTGTMASATTARSKGPPNLIISVPPDESRRWRLNRVPVPRLSRLPSPSLAKIRVALRTPRRQDFSGLPRSPGSRPVPSPLSIIPNDPGSPDTALPSAAPLTSRLATLMNRHT
ncbi:hypothetical protein C8R47DRAFT_366577 [Mycena vitilis]|nr:hypothetical protein C8R47DRAFT_366577 [Mycena vitilis]